MNSSVMVDDKLEKSDQRERERERERGKDRVMMFEDRLWINFVDQVLTKIRQKK